MACSTQRTVSMRRSYTDFNPQKEIRITLIGKTGNGKSASANTILNRDAFASILSPKSVTEDCEKANGIVCGQRVSVIDTPGICDTRYKEEDVMRKLRMCLSLAAPGPHVFLVVIRLDRFTREERQAVELLQQVFGEKAADFSLVLFTHGDQLTYRIEDFISQCPELSSLVSKCNGRYHVFDNAVPNEHQVPQLLKKIKMMISCNGGTFYTNQMFQLAEKAIQEKVVKILKDNADKKRREEEKLRAKFKGQHLQTQLKWLDGEFQTQARAKAEKRNKFIDPSMIAASAEAGLAIGTAAGAAGGPVCMAVGAVAGGAVGALVGVITPAAVKALRKKCTVQ